jgi:nitroimidazol reductase NimA-like FMN-containing flavoprotein (pyridoxamine 5'-phosphate oxidase superfamily)
MRRKDREISDTAELLKIIGRNKVCRLGMAENDQPYVVPLNFGYEYTDNTLILYFHGAREGKKIDLLRKNNRACFEIDGGHRLLEGESPWETSYAYESVIGFGPVEFLEAEGEKARGLNQLMKHQTGKDRDYAFDSARLKGVAVYKLTASSFTGKRHAPPEEAVR